MLNARPLRSLVIWRGKLLGYLWLTPFKSSQLQVHSEFHYCCTENIVVFDLQYNNKYMPPLSFHTALSSTPGHKSSRPGGRRSASSVRSFVPPYHRPPAARVSLEAVEAVSRSPSKGWGCEAACCQLPVLKVVTSLVGYCYYQFYTPQTSTSIL